MAADLPRALLVGAGGMGQTWAKNLVSHAAQVTLAGWVDIRPVLPPKPADKLGLTGVHTGDDLQAALAAVRPDFVVDVTVPEAHHGVTLTALAAGVPVLGEKPMADSMAHARGNGRPRRNGRVSCTWSASPRRYDVRIHAYRTVTRGEPRTIGHPELRLLIWARTSADFATRWRTSCCWTWRFTPSTPPAT